METPMISILKIEDLTSEEGTKDVLSECEVYLMDDDQMEEDFEEMIDIKKELKNEMPSMSNGNGIREGAEVTENKSLSEDTQPLSESRDDLKCKHRTNQAQFEAILNFMLVHQSLARGLMGISQLRTARNDLWEELTNILNKSGPPKRSTNGWKKVWGDYKNYIKVKVRRNKAFYQQPRGWPKKLYPLSRSEKRIANLLELTQNDIPTDITATLPRTLIIDKTQIPPAILPSKTSSSSKAPASSAVPSAASAATSSSSSPVVVVTKKSDPLNDETNEINSDEPSNGRYSPPLSRKYKKVLLQAQVDNQKDFAKESLNILGAINENLKGLLNVSVKNYELQQTRLQFEKEKFAFKKKVEAQRQQTELEKLQLQKDILRLKQEIAGIFN